MSGSVLPTADACESSIMICSDGVLLLAFLIVGLLSRYFWGQLLPFASTILASARAPIKDVNRLEDDMLADPRPCFAPVSDPSKEICAAEDDLASCWRSCRQLPGRQAKTLETCSCAAKCVCRAATTEADACEALDMSVASGDSDLAEAALVAGTSLQLGSSWLACAHERLVCAGVKVRPKHLVDLANAYGQEGRGDLAVDLWYSHRESPDFLTDILYGPALLACVSGGDFETAVRTATSAAWQTPSCTAGQTAMRMMACWLARRQDLVPALEAYSCVRRSGGQIDLLTYHLLIRASVRNSDMVQAAQLFCELTGAGYEPDFGVYSAMIRGYCTIGNVEEAMAFFQTMRQHGVAADASLFNSMLEGCAKRNMVSLTEKVLAEMGASDVFPSNQTISILLRLYGRSRNLARAFEVFEEMPRRYGLQINAHSYGSLISACLADNRVDQAIEAFQKMKRSGRVSAPQWCKCK